MDNGEGKQKYVKDSSDNKWYFHKKDLLSDRDVYSNGYFIVAWNRSYYNENNGTVEKCYIYTAFENHISFLTYLRKRRGGISAKQQYFEIIEGDRVQCFYVDIDYDLIKLKDFKYHDLSDKSIQDDINIIIQSIYKMAHSLDTSEKGCNKGIEIDKHILLYETPGKDKKSYHILCKIGVYNNLENIGLFNILKLYLKEYNKEYLIDYNIVDGSIYSKFQHFRMLGSNKACQDGRVKQFKEQFPFGTGVISYKYPNNTEKREERLIHDYLMSFITNPDGLVMVPVPFEYCHIPSTRLHDLREYSLSQEYSIRMFNLLGDDKNNFDIYNINGNIVNLKRLKSSWCESHKRYHDKMPSFLSVQYNGDVYFYCNRPNYPKKLLGNIGIEYKLEYKKKEYEDDVISDIKVEEQFDLCETEDTNPPELIHKEVPSEYTSFLIKGTSGDKPIGKINISKLLLNNIKYDLLTAVIPEYIDLKSIKDFIESPLKPDEVVPVNKSITDIDKITSINLFATDRNIRFADAIKYSGLPVVDYNDLLEYLCKSLSFNVVGAYYVIYDEIGIIRKVSIDYLKFYVVSLKDPTSGKSTNLYNLIRSEFRRFTVTGITFYPYSPIEERPHLNDHVNSFSLPSAKIVAEYHSHIMQLLLFHIKEILCNGDEASCKHLVACLADVIQFPRSPKRSAIILLGQEGCGKSIFTSFIMKMFLPHSGRCDSFKSLTSNFNIHLEGKIYYIVDDSNPAEHTDYEKLKSLVTEKFQLFTSKGVDSQQGVNYCRYLITTNRHDILKHISKHDRRFCFIECSDKMVGNFNYFKLLGKLLDDNRVCNMFYTYLLCYNLGDIDIDNPPITELKKTIINDNDVMGDFIDYLNSKSWSIEDDTMNYWDTINTDSIVLVDLYKDIFQDWRKKYHPSFVCSKSPFSKYFNEVYPQYYFRGGHGKMAKLNITMLKSH